MMGKVKDAGLADVLQPTTVGTNWSARRRIVHGQIAVRRDERSEAFCSLNGLPPISGPALPLAQHRVKGSSEPMTVDGEAQQLKIRSWRILSDGNRRTAVMPPSDTPPSIHRVSNCSGIARSPLCQPH